MILSERAKSEWAKEQIPNPGLCMCTEIMTLREVLTVMTSLICQLIKLIQHFIGREYKCSMLTVTLITWHFSNCRKIKKFSCK